MRVDPAGASALLISGGTLVASLITTRNNRRAQQTGQQLEKQRDQAAANLEDRRVGREEFDSIVRELRASLDDVQEQLAAEKEARGEAEERAHDAERRAEQCSKRVGQLEQVMGDAGLSVPPV